MTLSKAKLRKFLQANYGSRFDDQNTLEYAVDQFVRLNKAINKGFPVYAEECRPHNNTSCSFYQIRYLDIGEFYDYDKKKDVRKPYRPIFWVPAVMNESNGAIARKYCFKSMAVGMSHVLDATDVVFNILKACGGEYIQIRRVRGKP